MSAVVITPEAVIEDLKGLLREARPLIEKTDCTDYSADLLTRIEAAVSPDNQPSQ